MTLSLESYLAQTPSWPRQGQHILAQFDDDSIIVYQAYRPAIGHVAARNGAFGGDFSFSRMSWVKPNFLWMMYRSGWGTKAGQEITLAVRLRRTFFDEIYARAIASSFAASNFDDAASWKRAVAASDVRLQWDPDHDPSGAPVPRRAVQLGLRGATLAKYAREALSIEDISDFVAAQRLHARGDYAALVTPRERVYAPQV